METSKLDSPKLKIKVSAETESIEETESLLADLKVLNEKYDVVFELTSANYSVGWL